MIPALRARFNAAFTAERYARFRKTVAARAGAPIEFRLSETPCFLPAPLAHDLVAAGHALIDQLLGHPDYRRAADAVVPPAFRLAGGETSPTFIQVDFGLVRTDVGIEGRLVELQAFPSLYGFQALLAETAIEAWDLDGVTPYLGGLDATGYDALMRRALVGDHDPSEVVLLEIDPAHQKTLPDFTATERRWGVRAVDLRDVVREGRRLFAVAGGRRTRIARIYNRVIPDELERRGLAWPFPSDAPLDVEWTGGPDWYFRLSKFALPWLRHPWVPRTMFLDEITGDPPAGHDWVLKPLFSFAGGGIVFSPTAGDLAAIPDDRRRLYALQERVAFTPVIDTPCGPTQVEIRVMYVRDGQTYRAVLPLGRMGRGLMMGVDHNKGLDWVGAAAVLVEGDGSPYSLYK
ncbi:MAG: hypothetical protein R2752_02045 [Vicinamibacterales bacterium]